MAPAVIAKSGEDVVRAFLLACETKNSKVAGPAIASLQKIASQNALPRVRISMPDALALIAVA